MSAWMGTLLVAILAVIAFFGMSRLIRWEIRTERERAQKILRETRERCHRDKVLPDAEFLDAIARCSRFENWRTLTLRAGEWPLRESWEEGRALRETVLGHPSPARDFREMARRWMDENYGPQETVWRGKAEGPLAAAFALVDTEARLEQARLATKEVP